jgi:hypothetical protein
MMEVNREKERSEISSDNLMLLQYLSKNYQLSSYRKACSLSIIKELDSPKAQRLIRIGKMERCSPDEGQGIRESNKVNSSNICSYIEKTVTSQPKTGIATDKNVISQPTTGTDTEKTPKPKRLYQRALPSDEVSLPKIFPKAAKTLTSKPEIETVTQKTVTSQQETGRHDTVTLLRKRLTQRPLPSNEVLLPNICTKNEETVTSQSKTRTITQKTVTPNPKRLTQRSLSSDDPSYLLRRTTFGIQRQCSSSNTHYLLEYRKRLRQMSI